MIKPGRWCYRHPDVERKGGSGGRGFPSDSTSPLWRNILRGWIKDKMPELWSKRKLTPGPGQEDMSGDEEADKEEEEVRNQENHVLHLADWHDFHSTLFSDFCFMQSKGFVKADCHISLC